MLLQLVFKANKIRFLTLRVCRRTCFVLPKASAERLLAKPAMASFPSLFGGLRRLYVCAPDMVEVGGSNPPGPTKIDVSY